MVRTQYSYTEYSIMIGHCIMNSLYLGRMDFEESDDSQQARRGVQTLRGQSHLYQNHQIHVSEFRLPNAHTRLEIIV